MNKYKEALDNIFMQWGYKDLKDFNVIKELVDRDTPQKPINDFNEDDEPYLPRNMKLCPYCKKAVHSSYNYCPDCAQALDWSDEE